MTRAGAGLTFSVVSSGLKLYIKAWCPWCIDAKHYLDKRGYTYEEVDVERDEDAFEEMLELSGQAYTPTLVAGDKLLADFGTPELETFLKANTILP